MRLYAFLLITVAALHARAATLPAPQPDQKLIDVQPDTQNKVQENTSSEQELIDQANTIQDVENNLRVKPDDIPVKVVVEDAQPVLKTNEEEASSEEINRPTPDLRNPGPPQRQEHETQNPEFYASEQQTASNFKQSVIEAQNFLKQGFQGIAEGIQSMIQSNEPVQKIQQRIQALRDGFTSQINVLNGTIQEYLNNEPVDEPNVEKTKAGFHQIERGLYTLRTEFTKGVNNIADGINLVSLLRADTASPDESSPSASTAAPAKPEPPVGPVNAFFQYMTNLQNAATVSLQNFTETVNKLSQGQQVSWNPFNQPTSQPTDPAAVPADAQSDSPAPSPGFQFPQIFSGFQGIFSPPPGSFGSGSGPFQNVVNTITNIFQGKPASLSPSATPTNTQATPSKPATSKPEPAGNTEGQSEPAKPVTETQADATAAPGPIRQILQNNPITQGIAGAVQRLQNVNNPEKPREEEIKQQAEVQMVEEEKIDSESKKGGPNTGNSDDSSSRLEQAEAVKEEVEKVPEVQKEDTPKEVKEQMTEQVADKTE